MKVRFAREPIDLVLVEIKPLLQAHWAEIAHYPDIRLDPDYARYQDAEDLGQLRIFTVRQDDPLFSVHGGTVYDANLLGYAIYFIGRALHYQGSVQAKQDILYLDPAHRRGRLGAQLIAFADDALKAEGVQVVHQHVKVAHNFGPLLERLGYEHTENTYSRRLN